MPLFDIKRSISKSQDKLIADKSKQTIQSKITLKGGDSLIARINQIKALVEKHLGKYRDKYINIQDEETLIKYIDKCIENKCISLDTETTGLDPLLDEIAGVCIYTPGEHSAYIPINHINYITNEKIENQLSVDFVREQFTRLFEHTDLDVPMFNGTFDIRVMRNIGVKNIYCTWDCYIAMRILNENEERNTLKKLHQKYVLNDAEDEFTFDELFNGIPFTLIPLSIAYLYAAHDPEITYELEQYQKRFLRPDHERQDMRDLYWVFENIEMPCVSVVADLEDAGVAFDFDYNAKLKEKYHALLNERIQAFYDVVAHYKDKIDAYREKNKTCKLENPINIASTQQLGILLYDILGFPLFYDKKKKKETKSTSEEALLKIDSDVAKAILNYREFATLVSTFIDKMPECVNPKDGRVHCKFNQYGADTGRFSSQDPNLQNIPSHNKDIRQMFVASPGYVLLSSDYSQQEPSCLAALCNEMGYPKLYESRVKGDDIYSHVASACFRVPYGQCCEFDKNGNKNPTEYKERRATAKPVLLGILYGRGDDSVAEGMGITLDEAKKLKSNLYAQYPEIKMFEDESIRMAETLGYVTTVCGRKRRLPSMMLPDYEFKFINNSSDLLDFESDAELTVPDDVQDYWWNKITRAKFKDKKKIFEQANKQGIWIIDHTKDKDVTKIVNARIQGSAADLTKLAMIDLRASKELQDLGFRMLIPVHDEIIAECPEENVKECSRLLAETMSKAAEKILKMPFSCDVAITREWYGEEIEI